MLKTLKNQSRNKILLKNKIKLFIKKQLWQYLLIIAFVCFYAWLFDKWCQAIMFIIAHSVIRPRFDYQYHCNTTYKCTILTLSIALFGLYMIMPLNLSLLSTLPFTYLICWVGELAQIKVNYNKSMQLTIEQMTDEQFIDFCKSKHLSNEEIEYATLILRDKLKGQCLYSAMGYSMAQSKRIKKKILDKLK